VLEEKECVKQKEEKKDWNIKNYLFSSLTHSINKKKSILKI